MLLKLGKFIKKHGLNNKFIVQCFYFFYIPYNRLKHIYKYKLFPDSHFFTSKLDLIHNYQPHIIKQLERASTMTSVAPRDLEANAATTIVDVPELNLYVFNNAIVNEGSSCIVYENRMIYESYKKEEKFNYGFIKWHDTKYALVYNYPTENIDEGFFLAGIGSFNWYHWLIEILPKVMYLKDAPTKTILVSENLQKYSTMLESLKALIGDSFEIKILKKNKNYRVTKLYYVNEVNYYTFDVSFTSRVSLDGVYFRNDVLKKMSNKIQSHITFSNKPLSKRVFIYRGNYRIPKNQPALLSLLKKYEFEVVKMETLSFSDQIKLFQQAEIIIGMSGAAFSNIIFSTPATHFISFLPSTLNEFSCFSNIAQIFNLDLRYVIYPIGNDQPQNTNEFEIDIIKIENYIKTLL